MNVEIGTEAVQFPEKEYINGIFVAVDDPCAVAARVDRLWSVHSAMKVGTAAVAEQEDPSSANFATVRRSSSGHGGKGRGQRTENFSYCSAFCLPILLSIALSHDLSPIISLFFQHVGLLYSSLSYFCISI
jgi:hypothetical protein